ncbi:MAG: methionyl-tRNA formyltransferase [Gaiellaceae bacterium]
MRSQQNLARMMECERRGVRAHEIHPPRIADRTLDHRPLEPTREHADGLETERLNVGAAAGQLRVLLAAEEAAGVRALRLVLERGHRVVGVLTTGESRTGAADVAATARAAGVPILPAQLLTDPHFGEALRSEDVDFLLNVHSLFVIDREVLAAPRIGALNLHPGPLPEFAGLDAPSWVLYEGRRRYGCTVHWMTPRVDAGPIAYAAEFEITPGETGLSLSLKCVRHGLELLGELVSAAAEDATSIPSEPQPTAGRRWLRRGPPEGGRSAWGASAARVVGLVRACDFRPFSSPWGRARTTLEGREVEVVEAELSGLPAVAPPGTIGDRTAEGILVAAADEWVVVRRVSLGTSTVAAGEALPPAGRFEATQPRE